MNNRLTLAATVLSLGVLSVGCGAMPKADAGTGGGIGAGGGVGAGGGGGGATGGGGGGATGGGTATGGGGGVRACALAPPFVVGDLNGKPGYNLMTANAPPFNYATFARPAATAGRADVMFNEFYVDGPLAATPIPAKNYAMCDYCYYIQLGCDNMGNCGKSYLARSGTLAVTAATKNPDAGTYAFTLTNVTYEEWDFTADTAVDGGCLTLPSFSFSGTWP